MRKIIYFAMIFAQVSCVTTDSSGPSAAGSRAAYTHNFFKASSYMDAQAMMGPYKEVAAEAERLKAKGTEAALIRAGKVTAFNPATLVEVLKSAKQDDVIRLGKGTFDIIGDPGRKTDLASGVSIEGDFHNTLLHARWVNFKATRMSNLSLLHSDFAVTSPHRLWLENVRVVKSLDSRTPWEAIAPKGTSVVSVLGGFIIEPYQCSASMGDYNWKLCETKNVGIGSYFQNSLGTVSINAMTLPEFAEHGELKPFFTDYLVYLKSGVKPGAENAARAVKYLRSVIESGILNKTVHYYVSAAEATQLNDLKTATYVRLASILEREFGGGGPALPPDVVRQKLTLAEASMKQGRPLSALFHLQVLYGQGIGPADRKTVQAQIAKARTALARQYGTAIDYQLTGPHAEPEGLMHKSTKEQVEGRNRATLLDSITTRFPIARIADEASARFKVSIQQTRNEFTSRISNQKIEERTMLIEDPSVRAARQKAEADAAWSKFQSAISNIDATASAMERTARTNYEQRVRVEDAGSGKQMVWYDGKKNQGALNLSNPSLSSAPAPAGMLEVTATTKRYLFNNIVNVAYTATMTDKGKVIDTLTPFSKTQSWNFSCKTEKAPNSIGAIMENSDCFGGTGGRSGVDINQIAMQEVFGKWVQSHYENRVIAENIHRLEGAAKSKNKVEVAEMILLGRSLGIASSKEQESVLKDVFGEEKAFEKVLSVTTIQ